MKLDNNIQRKIYLKKIKNGRLALIKNCVSRRGAISCPDIKKYGRLRQEKSQNTVKFQK